MSALSLNQVGRTLKAVAFLVETGLFELPLLGFLCRSGEYAEALSELAHRRGEDG